MSIIVKQPLKVIHDKRLAYLVSLENIYKSEGYSTKLNGRDNLLEVYPKGMQLNKAIEDVVIENWID